MAFLTLSKNPISSENEVLLTVPDGGTGSGTPGTNVGLVVTGTGTCALFDTFCPLCGTAPVLMLEY